MAADWIGPRFVRGLAMSAFALFPAVAAACGDASVDGTELAGEVGRGTKNESQKIESPDEAGAPGTAEAAPASTCDDKTKNGDETDVDCGGSCSPCSVGRACQADKDCTPGTCSANVCCAKETVTKTTGKVSGTKQICCAAGGEIASVKDCGNGANHSVRKIDTRCAEAKEGSGNGGDACAEITCTETRCAADGGI